MYYVVSAPSWCFTGHIMYQYRGAVTFKMGIACTEISSFLAPPPPSPNYGGNRNISSVVAVSTSAVMGWSQEHGLDSGQQCKVMSHVGLLGSLFCIYFIYMIIHSCSNTSPFVIFP